MVGFEIGILEACPCAGEAGSRRSLGYPERCSHLFQRQVIAVEQGQDRSIALTQGRECSIRIQLTDRSVDARKRLDVERLGIDGMLWGLWAGDIGKGDDPALAALGIEAGVQEDAGEPCA